MKRNISSIFHEESTNLGYVQKKVWVKERSSVWWDGLNSIECPNIEFKNAFRMSKATFDLICTDLEDNVSKQTTFLREAIPVRQRVAVCIWRLAIDESLREISKRFGLGTSTCHKIVLEVCSAINICLMSTFISWPDASRMGEIKTQFENSYKISNVGGCIYTTHFETIKPKEKSEFYVNKRKSEGSKKPYYSVTLQGVVDHNGVFIYTSIGFPGSMTDQKVLDNSSLIHKANNNTMDDVWIVGNVNYSPMDWLLVPYTVCETFDELRFNEKVEEVNGVGKEAFMKLRSRWRCLMKRVDVKESDLYLVIGACCVLHNICEIMGEEISSDLMNMQMFD